MFTDLMFKKLFLFKAAIIFHVTKCSHLLYRFPFRLVSLFFNLTSLV